MPCRLLSVCSCAPCAVRLAMTLVFHVSFGAGVTSSAQSRLRHSVSVGGEAQDDSLQQLQQQQQQQQRAGTAAAGSSDTGISLASGTGGGGRAFSRAKSFVQQQLPWPSQATQEGGNEEAKDDGGGLRGGEDSPGGRWEVEPKAGGGSRAPAISRPQSRSFMDHLPRPWRASPRWVEDNDGGSRGRATNLGPLPRPTSLAEKFPRGGRQQKISQTQTAKEEADEEAERVVCGEKGGGGISGEGGGGDQTARATSVTEGLPPGVGGRGHAQASRGGDVDKGDGGGADANGNGGGNVGEGKPATRRAVTKARILVERLPRPKQVLQGKWRT